ncbi:plasmid partitioning protein RepA [Tropicimonas sp. IMCC34043]|uniref:plasmid partitioning protein RepA n=1 Tax=Tropicimonas sp. IMCC34043 TaxID=2248760 RepID=UPI000E25E765|nr:plasmid partitioning protein RepA [Tropicimonas sp. IMCC34043]
MPPIEDPTASSAVLDMADRLADALNVHQMRTFAPDARKDLRLFQAGEVADLLDVTPQFLRNLHAEGRIPDVHTASGGRRFYSAQAIQQIREILEKTAKKKGSYLRGRQEGEALQVLQLMNFKGGSAKTSTTLHLAHYLALHSYRVLAIDLDPQGSLTTMFGIRPTLDLDDMFTAYDAIKYDDPVSIRDCAHPTYFQNIDLVPAELQLQTFEHETAAVLRDTSRREVPFFKRLSVAISDVADDYDVVLIDSPPQLGFLTIAGAVASTGILVPIVPSMLDVSSTAQFLRMTGELLEVIDQQGVTMRYDFLKYLIARHEPSDGPQQQMVAFLRNLFGEDVLVSTALKSTAISDATTFRQSLYEVPRADIHRQTYDRALESMNAVGAEVEKLMHRAWGR